MPDSFTTYILTLATSISFPASIIYSLYYTVSLQEFHKTLSLALPCSAHFLTISIAPWAVFLPWMRTKLKFKPLHTTQHSLQKHMDDFISLFAQCRVKYIEQKTATIYFYKRKILYLNHIIINNSTISWNDHTKYLGLPLTGDLIGVKIS